MMKGVASGLRETITERCVHLFLCVSACDREAERRGKVFNVHVG